MMSDPFLHALNQTVQSSDVSFGITFMINGGVITGNLVSAKKFFKGFANSFADAWPGGPSENIREGFSVWGDAPEDSSVCLDFVHLQNARYVSGKDLVPNDQNGMLWRGKIESIDGYSLGSYASS
jgi:hypothetical protein